LYFYKKYSKNLNGKPYNIICPSYSITKNKNYWYTLNSGLGCISHDVPVEEQFVEYSNYVGEDRLSMKGFYITKHKLSKTISMYGRDVSADDGHREQQQQQQRRHVHI